VELGVYTFAELTPEVEGGPVVDALALAHSSRP
jgi:hypothetical protein